MFNKNQSTQKNKTMLTTFLSCRKNPDKSTPLSYCNDPYLKKSLLIEHQITPSDFEFRIMLFFGSPAIAYKSISLEDMENYMSNKVCGTGNIDFSVDYLNLSNNDEIALVESIVTHEVTYSVAYFQAMLEVFGAGVPIKEFVFSKAVSNKGDSEGRTIVLQVINANDEAVYCADLSGVYP